MVTLVPVPADLANSAFDLPLPAAFAPLSEGGDFVVEHPGGVFRVHAVASCREAAAVILPFDRFFDARVASALRLWRHMAGRPLGADHASLSQTRASKLVLTLRALDGRNDRASYRDIALALFEEPDVSARPWKTHDLRGRTIRLVQLGRLMMNGGYRHLLLHPYERRS